MGGMECAQRTKSRLASEEDDNDDGQEDVAAAVMVFVTRHGETSRVRARGAPVGGPALCRLGTWPGPSRARDSMVGLTPTESGQLIVLFPRTDANDPTHSQARALRPVALAPCWVVSRYATACRVAVDAGLRSLVVWYEVLPHSQDIGYLPYVATHV
ncbi:hypothetical protein EXIGLDRAFT_200750 [Exidia glandulosa HHB12029]|uniref:Uncharacterized protein n=1 Tax=Exidia glandulosa HHB12029 TaxID=1314781 RepID=A0A165ERQ0_EXIGL|nr:hypothetical protein EXIGLDRAFT_200750 [Exidia glandulosa HHB12029]